MFNIFLSCYFIFIVILLSISSNFIYNINSKIHSILGINIIIFDILLIYKILSFLIDRNGT